MALVKNFADMPVALKIITSIGMLSPLLVILTIATGNLGVLGDGPAKGYGFADNMAELSVIFISAIPISLCSFFMLKKSSQSRYWYIITWSVLFLSPIVFESTRKNIDVFLVESIFNLAVGVAISGYIVVGRSAKKYFQQT